jgi:hypothetical protein
VESESGTHWIKDHWITVLAGLCTVFVLFLGMALIIGPDQGDEAPDRLVGAAYLLAGFGMLAGLWGLRNGRVKLWVANTLFVIGLIATGLLFWLIIPLIVALIVLFAGVVRGGLERELSPA